MGVAVDGRETRPKTAYRRCVCDRFLAISAPLSVGAALPDSTLIRRAGAFDRHSSIEDLMTALGLIIACGLLAIVYGVWAIWSVMQSDPGSARMQEIAAAVREGAQAYLKRQYTTIGIVGAVIFLIVGWLLGWLVAHRLPDRRGALGRCGLHRHERLGARQRAHGPGRDRLAGRRPRARVQGRRDHRHVRRGSRAARRHRLLRDPHRADGPGAEFAHRGRRAGGARLRRFADLDLRPARRRHLHQGRRRRRRSGRQGRSRHPGGRSAQSRDHRRQRRRQRRRLRRHGGRPVRDLRGDRGRHHGSGGDLLRRHAAA